MTPAVELLLLLVATGVAITAAYSLVARRSRVAPGVGYLERMTGTVRGVPPPGRLQLTLVAAGFRGGAPSFLLTCALVGLIGVLVTLWIRSDALLLALVAGMVFAVLPWFAISSWSGIRARRFETGLVEGVSYLINTLEAGENPAQGFASVAGACRDPVRTEFREVARRLALGMDVSRVLGSVAQRYDSPGTRLFCQTVIAKWQAGGELAPVLRSLNRTMRERIRLRLRLRSQLVAARVSSVLAAVLPWTLIPFFVWQRPDWIDRLVQHPLGLRLLIGAALLQLLGFVWLQRLLRIEL